MTLREQIKIIHAKYLGQPLNEFRGDMIPMMLNDLAIKLFDSLQRVDRGYGGWWYVLDSVDIRAIKHARNLLAKSFISEDLPAVE